MRLLCSRARSRNLKHSKSIDPADFRKTKTKAHMCPSRVNIRLTDAGVYHLSSVNLCHDHPAFFLDRLPEFNPPSDEQKSLVRELITVRSLGRQEIQMFMKARFPDRPLNLTQISNLVNQAKLEARNRVENVGGDMVATVALLTKLKGEDERWVVHVEVDAETRRFRRVFWMSPGQVTLAHRFGDVIVNDITLMRNKYNIPLNIWIIVDHQFKTRNIAYALHTSETMDDHEWVLNHLFAVLPPMPSKSRAYFSDFDLALSSVVSSLDVWHGLCLHHLGDNVTKNLAPVLGALFRPFQDAFWQVYHAMSPSAFELKWNQLLTDYPSSRDYLQKVLWPTRERWAWTWVSTRFTCGVRTSGRVESENKVNKLLGNTKTTLFDLVKKLIERAEEQAELEQLSAREVRCNFYHLCPDVYS
jgi:hypothetical protein